MDDAECDALLALATRSMAAGSEASTGAPGSKQRAHLMEPTLETECHALSALSARVASLAGLMLGQWVAHHTTQKEGAGPRETSLGLHVDTLHAPRRFVTALLYLTTVPVGGETIFPLATSMAPRMPWLGAAEERARGAGQRLLDFGIGHTLEVLRAFERSDPMAAAADCIELYSADPSHGLTVKPLAGDVILFFTRRDSACVDASSWHGGLSVIEGCKWTLQNFVELPHDVSLDSAAAYIAGRRQHAVRCTMNA